MDDQNKKPEFKYRGPKEVEDLFVVLYDYNAQRNDELDLVKGEELLVLVRENENWWMGEQTRTKKQGYFPANYVQDAAQAQALNQIKKSVPSHFVPPPKFNFKDAMNEIHKTSPDDDQKLRKVIYMRKILNSENINFFLSLINIIYKF